MRDRANIKAATAIMNSSDGAHAESNTLIS